MRCPDTFRAGVLACTLLLPLLGHAGAEQVRSEITARLKQDHPTLAPADYVLGAAAFDESLRARLEENANAAVTSGVLEAGRKLWTRPFRNGRSLAACFPNGGRRVAATYPHYDARLKRIVTLETAVNQCLKSNREALLEPADPATMGALTAYLRSLSDKQKQAVRVSAAAEEKFESGRSLYFSRLGQRNYACSSCHLQGAGKRFAGTVLSPALGQAVHWPVIREGKAITLQARIRECLELMGAAPFPAGSDELNHLEYFLTYLSNGLPLRANAWRPGV